MRASENLAGGRLTIDRDAIAANWSLLKGLLKPGTTCAATIKADAYGTGATSTAERLWEAGCTTFFVALPEEGAFVRSALPDATVYILGGLFPGIASDLAGANLIPVLNSVAEVREWAGFCKAESQAFPAALQLNTGMNRLGMDPEEFADVMAQKELTTSFDIALLMTHLACGSDPEHPLNRQQLNTFVAATQPFSTLPRSMANSAGVFLGPDYHFDLARPGISLYGGKALDTAPNIMSPVAMVEARVMQIRNVPKGQTIGYGGAETVTRDSKIALVAAGYADGLHRRAGSSDDRPGGFGVIGSHKVPLIGRVSMDMIALDVTDVPGDAVTRGSFVEMLGPNVAASDLAAYAETIDYEYLTGLGRRYHRRYAALPAPQER
ncbi:alanine racemase [Roseibium polysiphoniae]|uniref:Alanine racemase n=1 Tax=Roseibium polysiphoniae TaxID=2571221 RepID=A0A944CAY4_9HYPH|nr:alanine racemase [Roseibium polysiphoniae]MBS8259145.1 alanine racemase [Roseibium polysiphoniae]